MVPRSEIRVSVVRSGFWNTVMRTESPSPSASRDGLSRDWPYAPADSAITAIQSKATSAALDGTVSGCLYGRIVSAAMLRAIYRGALDGSRAIFPSSLAGNIARDPSSEIGRAHV